VFNASGVTAFASGGIVNKPTLFPFASGIGLMGERGPEAIMPLKRTSSGDLGVQAEGGGVTNITMNINAVDSQSFVQMLRNNKAAVESLVIENIYRNGSVRKAIQQGV
jgi:phage-related minor tail protein